MSAKLLNLFQMNSFENKYAEILSDLIRYGKLERRFLQEMTNELLEYVDYEAFHKVYTCAPMFPNMELQSDPNDTLFFQTASFIGYLRGCAEALDAISQHLKYSLLEYPDEVNSDE